MAIYYITTREHASRGGEFSRTCLFDRDRLVAILDYKLRGETPTSKGQGQAYVTSKGHEIADFIGLTDSPTYLPKNEAGWCVLEVNKQEIKISQSDFDMLVKEILPYRQISHFLPHDRRLEKRVA